MTTFQNLISTLTNFWAEKGCIVHQGHDVEVGAGTFNPATFLRSLGPEPYQTVYVEPSRRPQDGRYGENPNRVQLFHQLQVIMKPSPIDIQTTYIDSLKAIGFDLSTHDLRFVHDDWESPTIGAWGLGWEVWIDGMEITQFTYFQALANFSLHPIPIELTYGLERLAMILQDVDSIFDIKWNDTITYGEVCKRNEQEWSRYNFEQASTKMWLAHFNDFEKESKDLIEQNLPIPAYDFVMKASHAFNMLEARGVLSTTERTGYIARIRNLAKLVASQYMESRKEQNYPLLSKGIKTNPPEKPKAVQHFDPKQTDDFVLEIGSEQLPATYIPIGCLELEKKCRKLLDEQQISYGKIEIFATPRRLAIIIHQLSHGNEDQVIERRGPPISIAFDDAGKITEKGKGFLTSLNFPSHSLDEIRQKSHASLFIQEHNGKEYLFANAMQKGISTANLLMTHLPNLIGNLPFPKKMRWSDLEIEYGRPLQWILCLFGKNVLSFTIGNIVSGNQTFGHAQRAPHSIAIDHPHSYEKKLEKNFVLASVSKREKSILSQLEGIEKETNAVAINKSKVLSEVIHLTEWPELTYTGFDPEFLKAPKEVLISEMVQHQRYFPLQKDEQNLANVFVITADNAPTEEIRQGNRKVLSARLSDGVFLYEQDLKISLDAFNEKLKNVVFQQDLGSLFDKEKRLVAIAQILTKNIPIEGEKHCLRAASLCKADLVSNLVAEFPELQGTIGKYYALAAKEDLQVAMAIEEHYLPRFEDDALPQNDSSILLSLADRLDNLIGYFSVGLKPSSSHDPYALRRTVIGLLKILIEHHLSVDLDQVLIDALQCFPTLHGKINEQKRLREELLQFITARATTLFHEYYEFKKEEVEASLQGSATNPYDQYCQLKALNEFRTSSDQFAKLFEVYKRARGQLEGQQAFSLNPKFLTENPEVQLNQHLDQIKPSYEEALLKKNYTKAYEILGSLQDPLANLFDHVKILADDPNIQNNRLALLQKVFSLFSKLLDFSKIR